MIKCSPPGRPHYLNSCPQPGRMFENLKMILILLLAATTPTSTSYINGYRVSVHADRLFTLPNQARRFLNSPPKRKVKVEDTDPLPTYYIPTNSVIRMK